MIDREKDLDRILSRELKKFGNVYPVENIAINGMPDFYFTGQGKTIWIEDKITESEEFRLNFRAGQAKFLYDNNNVVETYVLVYNKSNKLLSLFSGLNAYLLQSNKMKLIKPEFTDLKIKEIVKWLISRKN
jgi:hypothetical protein